MIDKLTQLKEHLGEIADINNSIKILSWDQQVNMPPNGNQARGQQLATLSKIAHEKLISDEIGQLLEALKQEVDHVDSDDAALVMRAAHQYDKAKRVPSSFIADKEMVVAKSFSAWKEARQKSDFSIFEPHMEKILELTHQYISYFPASEHPYDILLDNYEREMKTSDVIAIFNSLRPQLIEFIKEVRSQQTIDNDFMFKSYNEKQLIEFGTEVVTRFGYDWRRGRLDKAEHPFMTPFSVNDVRITTRYEKENPLETIFSIMHEAGHAIYEQNINPSYERTPLAGGTSFGIHESQSRLWENLVGRSLPFWEYFYPHFKKTFGVQLDGINLNTFYKGINKVNPEFIRVNADEATYNLHIMLRFEIELGLVEGKIAIKDLPEIWNTKMKEYLDITPPNVAKGVLQDVHWSLGHVGYFSTYALGNLISAQLWEKAHQDIPALNEQIRNGNFNELLSWLHRNMHQYGQKYAPQELVEKITGSKISSEPYMRYLTKKYSAIAEM